MDLVVTDNYIRSRYKDSMVVSGSHYLRSGQSIVVDTRVQTFPVYLPASPYPGCTATVYDGFGSCATKNCFISRNTKLVRGLSEDIILDVNYCGLLFEYLSDAYGWTYHVVLGE